MGDNSDFEALLIPILVVLGNYRKHKITQFYTAPTAIRSLAKEC
jgi:hypothetical protein